MGKAKLDFGFKVEMSNSPDTRAENRRLGAILQTSQATKYATLAGVGALFVAATVAVERETAQNESLLRAILIAMAAAALIAALAFWIAKKRQTQLHALAEQLNHIQPGRADLSKKSFAGVDPGLSQSLIDLVDRYEASVFDLEKTAVTDPVSGVTNRIHFVRQVEEQIAHHGERSLILGVIDVNRYRRINDQIGVRRADDLLMLMGQRLKDQAILADQTFRTGIHSAAPILLGRLSGVQFGVLIPMSEEGLADEVLQQIQSGFSEPFDLGDEQITLSVTSAAAAFPQDAATGPELIKHVESALGRAKQIKQSGPYFYNKTIANEARERLRLEDEVRRGVDNGEFIAVFQPKVELKTGRVTGAEALARWRRPDGSVVSPGEFIPVAEELGLISKLGVSVMRDACHEAARWNSDGEKLCVAVNVSPHQFEDPGFIPAIYDSLEESGLAPDRLELEITETVAVENPQSVMRVMRPLRARGVRLAIDDFGTGHSNFTTVTQLPFDVFKIDQQFVRALSKDPQAPAIIEMILAMSEALGLETVAEGLETVEQFDFLNQHECSIGQGYYFSPPLPAHQFSTFLQRRRSSLDDALTGAA